MSNELPTAGPIRPLTPRPPEGGVVFKIKSNNTYANIAGRILKAVEASRVRGVASVTKKQLETIEHAGLLEELGRYEVREKFVPDQGTINSIMSRYKSRGTVTPSQARTLAASGIHVPIENWQAKTDVDWTYVAGKAINFATRTRRITKKLFDLVVSKGGKKELDRIKGLQVIPGNAYKPCNAGVRHGWVCDPVPAGESKSSSSFAGQERYPDEPRSRPANGETNPSPASSSNKSRPGSAGEAVVQ